MTNHITEDDVLQRTEDAILDASINIHNKVRKGSGKCIGDRILLNSFNCLSGIGFNVAKMEKGFTDCLDDAANTDEVDTCIDHMKNDINTLKQKLDKGISCKLVSRCKKPGNKFTTTPHTTYCLAHTGPGVAHKCIKKVKDGTIKKMSKKDIDQYMSA